MAKINVRGWFNLAPEVAQVVYENATIGKCNEFVETAVLYYIRNRARNRTPKHEVDLPKYERHYKAALARKNGEKLPGNNKKALTPH